MHWVMGDAVFLGAMTLWHRHRVPGLDVAGLMAGCAAQAVWLLTDKDLPSWGWVLWVFLSSGTLPFATLSSKKERLSKEALAHRPGRAQIHFLLIHTWFSRAHGRIWASPTDLRVDDLWADRWLWQRLTVKHQPDQTILAWFAAATTLFVTLIFPIQFQHQWLTIGWAMEKATHLALQHPTPGVAHGREQFISGRISSFEQPF